MSILFAFCILLILNGYGGEGGIRTPDRLTPMSDFESGAFNRALPPLRVLLFYLRTSNCCIGGCKRSVDLS
jgi:hypothetical protein